MALTDEHVSKEKAKALHQIVEDKCCFCVLIMGSQVALVAKSLPASAGDLRDTSLIPGSGRSPAGGNGNSLQDSCLENPMDRGAW